MILSLQRGPLFARMLSGLQVIVGTLVFASHLTNDLRAKDNLVDFEMVEIGKPVIKWEDQGLQIELAHPPKKSKAIGRITFFPHLGTGHKGVVNAMANEVIPVRFKFEREATRVTARLWGSTTSAAFLEAFDRDGRSLGKQEIARVPVRNAPEDPVPFFELSVDARDIAYIEIGGAKPGGFVAVDELRWTTN